MSPDKVLPPVSELTVKCSVKWFLCLCELASYSFCVFFPKNHHPLKMLFILRKLFGIYHINPLHSYLTDPVFKSSINFPVGLSVRVFLVLKG